ncbi:uncharacterized protein LOC9311752 isoform X1 [Arabidopsis lyrata subsp. lyrata]|uniref:uncharacterized protein LOC9311752 isoform X1 n=1 Tax=Arabidopsis lyrata subsp. lyrata TaxID=81972 RepID=UPI000A29A8D9|nr:uncharacterized protein LOC9311752 isoform X1 [Arabidopsis lyrata subsp. lyrata]XP_020880922.1 uncharacterized protein LOC9311752 isoform X1 [Arabidopsis lyrata subsp. lyrata]|eukprot:XP_020880921.1 uncharacterized protein LOC9311752 isoform X1 [Arabidopsis lyrata subsp. lyrata]
MKIRRSISWEEINERRLKGLCVFCEEPETLDHHLKHKKLGILMIDGDEDQLPNVEFGESIEHRKVKLVCEAQEENLKLENHEMLVQKAILEKESIPPFQVPLANSDILRSMELREVNLGLEMVLNENLEQEWVQKNISKRFEVEGDVEKDYKVPSITENDYAHKVFDKMPLIVHSKKRHIKCPKGWRFKFKQRSQHKGRSRKAHKQTYRGVVKYKYPCSNTKVALMKKNKFTKVWSMLKDDCYMEDDQVNHETFPVWLLVRFKFWKFKLMNMNLQKMMREYRYSSLLQLMFDKGKHDEKFSVASAANMRGLLGIMSDQERHDAILRSAPYANLGTISFMEIDSLSDQSQLIQEQARNHSTDSIMELSLLQPKDSFLKHQPQTVSQCLLVGRLYEQAHQKGLIIRKDGGDYEKGAQPLNFPREAAGLSLSNIQMHIPSPMDKDSTDEKQVASVGVNKCLQPQELNCLSIRLKRKTLQDLQKFTIGVVLFLIKHKWRFKFLHSASELLLYFDSLELSTSYANLWDCLWTGGSSTVRYEYSIWKQSDKGTQLFSSRRLVVYKLGSEAKNVIEVSQRVYQLVKLKFAKDERKLEVIQSQTFDPGIGLESQELLENTYSN